MSQLHPYCAGVLRDTIKPEYSGTGPLRKCIHSILIYPEYSGLLTPVLEYSGRYPDMDSYFFICCQTWTSPLFFPFTIFQYHNPLDKRNGITKIYSWYDAVRSLRNFVFKLIPFIPYFIGGPIPINSSSQLVRGPNFNEVPRCPSVHQLVRCPTTPSPTQRILLHSNALPVFTVIKSFVFNAYSPHSIPGFKHDDFQSSFRFFPLQQTSKHVTKYAIFLHSIRNFVF